MTGDDITHDDIVAVVTWRNGADDHYYWPYCDGQPHNIVATVTLLLLLSNPILLWQPMLLLTQAAVILLLCDRLAIVPI